MSQPLAPGRVREVGQQIRRRREASRRMETMGADRRRDPLDPDRPRNVEAITVRAISSTTVELGGDFWGVRAHLDELGVRRMPSPTRRDHWHIQQVDCERVLDSLSSAYRIQYAF